MKKRLLAITLSLCAVIFIYYIIFFFYAENDNERYPIAINGLLDLSDYSLLEEDAIPLDGEWEFIPNRLLTQEEFDQYPSTLVTVPSIWTDYTVNKSQVDAYGSATYRLRVRLHHKDRDLALKTTNIRMSNRIFIDGKLLKQSGNPKEDVTYEPENNPYTVYFQEDENELDILVHVANYHYASGGGIVGSIYFGSQESIIQLSRANLSQNWLMFAIFFTIGTYFLGYHLQFRKEWQLLFFSFHSFSIALYTVTHGEKILTSVFPNIPYELFIRLQCISGTFITMFLLLFYFLSLRDIVNKYLVYILTSIGVISLFSALLPIHIFSNLEFFYGNYSTAVILYVSYITILAVLHQKKGGIYLFLALLSVGMMFAAESYINFYNPSFTMNYSIYLYSYILMLALYVSHIFTSNYLNKDELTNQLLAVDRLKDEFLAKTSHEFRTPLHGIIAISDSMQERESVQEKEKLKIISDTAKRLSNLVNDILDFSKIKQGTLSVEQNEVDLYSSVQSTINMLSFLVKGKVLIINKIPPGLRVLADENRLRQIIYNLVGNAVKHTDSGEITIASSVVGDRVYIEVSDTGEGIPLEKILTIFEPFYSGDDSAVGVGLGLSITKELIELHGGSISVQSKCGEGSIFTFDLPISKKEGLLALPLIERDNTIRHVVDERVPPPRFVESEKAKHLILIADDDPTNLKVLVDILSTEGYAIIAVSNGREAFEVLRGNSKITIALLDVMMPELTGFEVCQLIRKTHTSIELPIIMLTAALFENDAVAALEAGANDFLHKPFQVSELKKRVENLILIKESAQKATEMELAFLQAQIKPHFIYNVLNSILSLSYKDINKTRELVLYFSKFLRASFASVESDRKISLRNEIELTSVYVNIEKVRFPNMFEFDIQINANMELLIPSLLIQPLVENSLRHGVNGKTDGTVNLNIIEKEEYILIEVIDNGHGMNEELQAEILSEHIYTKQGVGLWNTVRRIRQIKGADIGIASAVNEGTKITIQLPKIM